MASRLPEISLIVGDFKIAYWIFYHHQSSQGTRPTALNDKVYCPLACSCDLPWVLVFELSHAWDRAISSAVYSTEWSLSWTDCRAYSFIPRASIKLLSPPCWGYFAKRVKLITTAKLLHKFIVWSWTAQTYQYVEQIVELISLYNDHYVEQTPEIIALSHTCLYNHYSRPS